MRLIPRFSKVPSPPSLALGLIAALLATSIFLPMPLAAVAPSASETAYPPLRSTRDKALQAKLEQMVSRLGLGPATSGRQLAMALVDLENPHAPRLAAVNGDVMMYSASLPKIAILLGAFARIEEGRLELTPELERDLADMMRRSSNVAATRVLDMVGRDYLIQLLRSDRHGKLYDSRFGGGLWVGKPYGPEGAYRRDPINGFSHGATPIMVARFYYLMETGQLVSPWASAKMKQLMGGPAIQHKFVKALTSRYPHVQMYRKSGTWRSFHSDSAIVEHDGKRYILVALSNGERGGQWLEQIALAADELIPVARLQPQAAPRKGVSTQRPGPTRQRRPGSRSRNTTGDRSTDRSIPSAAE